jgi:hypothetical protein
VPRRPKLGAVTRGPGAFCNERVDRWVHLIHLFLSRKGENLSESRVAVLTKIKAGNRPGAAIGR